MSRPPVDNAAPQRVSTIELFFDLVFVFTVTQVTSVVVLSTDAAGIGQAAVELSVIFWMYGGFAWLTNTNQPNTLVRRMVLLAGMAAFFVVSMAVPRAFQDSGVAFGIAYLVVVLVHGAGFMIFGGRAAWPVVSRFLPWNLLSATLLLIAGFIHGRPVLVVWVIAALIQLSTPFVIRLKQDFAISAVHFGERHGLVILIVLGESLVGVALASEHERIGARLVTGALAGLLVLTAMWWLYFDGEDELAVEAMERAPAAQRPMMAITGYFFAHYAMIFGVLLFAAGIRLGTDNLLVKAPTSTAWLVAVGSAMFALGSAGFRLALHFANSIARAVAAVSCLLTPLLGLGVSSVLQLCALTAILVAPMVFEHRKSVRSPNQLDP